MHLAFCFLFLLMLIRFDGFHRWNFLGVKTVGSPDQR